MRPDRWDSPRRSKLCEIIRLRIFFSLQGRSLPSCLGSCKTLILPLLSKYTAAPRGFLVCFATSKLSRLAVFLYPPLRLLFLIVSSKGKNQLFRLHPEARSLPCRGRPGGLKTARLLSKNDICHSSIGGIKGGGLPPCPNTLKKCILGYIL